MNWGVIIGVTQEIVIGAYTKIADDCIIYDTDWHSANREDEALSSPVHIGENVWLGARVIVTKGVHIGDNSIMGANSTVTQDIPANVLAAGNPARVIRTIDENKISG